MVETTKGIGVDTCSLLRGSVAPLSVATPTLSPSTGHGRSGARSMLLTSLRRHTHMLDAAYSYHVYALLLARGPLHHLLELEPRAQVVDAHAELARIVSQRIHVRQHLRLEPPLLGVGRAGNARVAKQ